MKKVFVTISFDYPEDNGSFTHAFFVHVNGGPKGKVAARKRVLNAFIAKAQQQGIIKSPSTNLAITTLKKAEVLTVVSFEGGDTNPLRSTTTIWFIVGKTLTHQFAGSLQKSLN